MTVSVPTMAQPRPLYSTTKSQWDEIWSQIHSSGSQCQVFKNMCCSVQKLLPRSLNHPFHAWPHTPGEDREQSWINHCQSGMIHPCLKLCTFLKQFRVCRTSYWIVLAFFYFLSSIWVSDCRVGAHISLEWGSFCVTTDIKKTHSNRAGRNPPPSPPLDNFVLLNSKSVGLSPPTY